MSYSNLIILRAASVSSCCCLSISSSSLSRGSDKSYREEMSVGGDTGVCQSLAAQSSAISWRFNFSNARCTGPTLVAQGLNTPNRYRVILMVFLCVCVCVLRMFV